MSSILGAWLTFSPIVWYPVYTGRTAGWNLTPAQDQQIGGLMMRVSLVSFSSLRVCIFFAKWIKDSRDAHTFH